MKKVSLILEGPDGAGKSFLAAKFNWAIPVHFGGPPKTALEFNTRCNTFLKKCKFGGGIFDRCPALSEIIYGSILRGSIILPAKKLINVLFKACKYNTLFIYCRPGDEIIFKNTIVEKAHKPLDHVSEVIMNRKKIIDAYDLFMPMISNLWEGRFFIYNWSEESERKIHLGIGGANGKNN